MVEGFVGSPTGPVHLMKNQPGFAVSIMGTTELRSTVFDPGAGSVVPAAGGETAIINVVVGAGPMWVSPQGAGMIICRSFLLHT